MGKRSTGIGREMTREMGNPVMEAVGRGLTVGLDLGDRFSHYCVLDGQGQIVAEGRVATTRAGIEKWFGNRELGSCRIALEVGTHSPWVSRALKGLGHEVQVANSRKLRLIYQNRGKSDRVDARSLARVARMDPALLSAVEHRGEQAAQDLAVLRTRDVLVRTRVRLINHVRGAVKATGRRLTGCSTRSFASKAQGVLAEELKETLGPVLEAIEGVGVQIRRLDRRIAELAKSKYPESELLRQVPGVGVLVALAYMLTVQDPGRFARSRTVGAYLGLVPGRRQSGEKDPQLRITKEGDGYVRRLLVQGAQYIVGPFGPDSDLRRFGLAMAARGGGHGKKRAVVAVARKLAVLLHRLWRTGEVYEPLRQAAEKERAVA